MITCMICDRQFKFIVPNHLKIHGLTMSEYRKKYPDAELCSEETRKKISKALTGYKQSPEHHENESKAQKGRKISPEHRAKISRTRTGQKKCLKHREKISKALTGLKRSPEACENISKALLGRKLSLEHCKKLREAQLAYLASSRFHNQTRWEKELASWLIERGIEFNYNYQIPGLPTYFGGHPYDFFLPKYNLIIELDGCYWHGCPTCYPNNVSTAERDNKLTEVARNLCYRVLRIWEHDNDKKFDLILAVLEEEAQKQEV